MGSNTDVKTQKKRSTQSGKHCKQRAEENIAPVSLFDLDSKEYKIEQCFVDGRLLESKKSEGYR